MFPVFLQVTFTLHGPGLQSSTNKMTTPIHFCLPSTHETESETHLASPLCHVCGERRTPTSNQNQIIWLFCGHSRTGESNGLSTTRTHTRWRAHAHGYTHHYSMASPYEVISVTDLCLLLLCHQACHTAWLLWQPLSGVGKRREKNKHKVPCTASY